MSAAVFGAERGLVVGGLAIPISGGLIYLVIRSLTVSAPHVARWGREVFAPTPGRDLELTYRLSPQVATEIESLVPKSASDLAATHATGDRSLASFAFISYRRDDSDVVDRLEEYLNDRGIATWRDPELEVGQSWTDQLQDRIERCAAFIVVMSGDRPSDEVQKEIAWAQRFRRPFFPLSLDGGLYFALGSMQHVKLSRAGSVSSEIVGSLGKSLA
jgi:hypothetical protein